MATLAAIASSSKVNPVVKHLFPFAPVIPFQPFFTDSHKFVTIYFVNFSLFSFSPIDNNNKQ